ncbi:hypothetical protein [Leptolyngbya sp. FACHB-711]|uniref:hypothetical protein n=1 Tax=unclassified Leptolyngbya TaxID=2650499 RepID=UPI001682AEB8|nr:hypothetical protein [Leptolyngbya sp. FACHB-711]MBD1852116.1 hypothetical protein [Cyanobacteria bacterium FACHB-502]MBD2026431.1 hypothetical protein [Leptolyngbya sp. FACHB-711]
MIPSNLTEHSLQKTLDAAAAKTIDRKQEIVALLSDEQPRKSREVEQSYRQCIWWEGCYYCQDEQQNWHQVKCFL